ncbi:hypothetical protein E3N88_03765 [Mikania micrantha]|uniref:Uncharacterized protein n=1 Tax=Mikania micrantha TaxID=192012 RepID=A0A5N6L7R7_9ASTR|nr:hypothetical protein E3N88_45906 [Mikania micrantha]KAD7116497.1 hypothetical protein E3N88_03765 [Mikania micrantha]
MSTGVPEEVTRSDLIHDPLIPVVDGKHVSIHTPSEQFTMIHQSEVISDLIGDVKVNRNLDSVTAAPSRCYSIGSGPLPGSGPQMLGQEEPKRIITPKLLTRQFSVDGSRLLYVDGLPMLGQAESKPNFSFKANDRNINSHGKTFKKPRRPYEKERLDAELKLVGEYGLRCKRELWRVQYALSRIRNAARMLLTLEEKDPRRIFEGEALMRRMNRYGLLDESQNKLDYVLALTVENFLERRLQTLVFKSGMAKSIHHARVLIKQRHIRVGRQVVNVPSFMVRVDSQKHIDFSLTSPFGGGRPGRVKRKNQKAAAKKAAGGDADEDDEE